MIGLAMRFAGGRYHATPWGAHVNEAAVEWPPSPWRLLRSLVSAWHRTAPDLAAAEVRDLLDSLAAPPSYRLPSAIPAHTRHYMPDGNHRREVRLTQNLVFDAFLRVAPTEPVVALWDTDLAPAQAAILRRLVAGVTYLGRSESWCDIEVIDEDPGAGNVNIGVVTDIVPDAHDVVRLLGVTRPLDLRTLDVSSADLQGGRQKRRDPPGSVWIGYARPREWARPRPLRRPRDRTVVAQVVVWALAGRPAPLVTRVSDVARRVRELIRLGETAATGRLRVFAYPSEPDLRPARLDRVVLWAERGLDQNELDRACRLGPFTVPDVGSVQTPLLLAVGMLDRMYGGPFGPARTWRSITPLVPWSAPDAAPGVAERVAALLGRRRAHVLGPADGPVRWVEFRERGALGARVTFPEPVMGPLLAERQRPGLGLFLPEP